MVKAREVVSLVRVFTSPWTIGVVVAAVVGGIWLWRRRSGESFGTTIGRTVGETAAGAVTGAVTGIITGAGQAPEEIAGALTGAIVGETGFTMTRVPGRPLWSVNRNILRLQGRLTEPEGEDSGVYEAEIQNTSDIDLSGVVIKLVVDKWGLDPHPVLIEKIDIPAHTGVRFIGRIVASFGNTTARLHADSFLMGETT